MTQLTRRLLLALAPLALAGKALAAVPAPQAQNLPSILPHLSLEMWWRPA